MKGYSAFPKAPVLLEPQYQIVHIKDACWEVLNLCRDAVSVFVMVLEGVTKRTEHHGYSIGIYLQEQGWLQEHWVVS